MNGSGIKHICFDKDGTIIDVHGYWAHICGMRAERLGAKYGLSSEHIEVILTGMGIDSRSMKILKSGPVGYGSRHDVIQGAYQALKSIGVGCDVESIDAAFKSIDAYQQETDDYRISILPGVEHAFSELTEMGIKLTIYSGDRSFNSRWIMEKLGLGGMISAYAGGDTVEKPKPDPEGFMAVCGIVGHHADESAYVGDTISDMHMAVNAGCFGIGVLSGLGDEFTLGEAASVVLPGLDHIKPLAS